MLVSHLGRRKSRKNQIMYVPDEFLVRLDDVVMKLLQEKSVFIRFFFFLHHFAKARRFLRCAYAAEISDLFYRHAVGPHRPSLLFIL